ncbi:general transcription factor II-I repeat domain-containing protein 2A-like [Watersipora subatra]|uniref:general transcription factor II-I repeat domain-containing protein 2A-like n=1 Tax=Watersipora subatra TaxID=2589382 RepID=UPI00355C1E64
MDVAQLAVFVRLFDGEEMKELLTLVGLEGKTTDQATYEALVKRLDKIKIPLHKCKSVTTDGAPAMVGKYQGLIARLKKDMPSMLAFHCIIHQTVLCVKLNYHIQQLMCKAMKMINFLRSQSALRHRKLKTFLKGSDATCEDLLTYNNIRWLSKGNALSRLWSIRQELSSFLNTCKNLNARQFQEMMSSSKDMSDLAFLVDICGHLNDLNLKLQGKNKTIINTLPAVQAFSHKLELFLVNVQGDMLHFPTLKASLDDDEEMASCTAEYTHFIEKLQQEFSNRFSQFQSLKHIIQLIKAPQKAKPNGVLTETSIKKNSSNDSLYHLQSIYLSILKDLLRLLPPLPLEPASLFLLPLEFLSSPTYGASLSISV